jgi:hypothetical protein
MMKNIQILIELNLFLKKFRKFIADFTLISGITHSTYMKDFFLINEILLKIMTIYTLYQENLSQYSLKLR